MIVKERGSFESLIRVSLNVFDVEGVVRAEELVLITTATLQLIDAFLMNWLSCDCLELFEDVSLLSLLIWVHDFAAALLLEDSADMMLRIIEDIRVWKRFYVVLSFLTDSWPAREVLTIVKLILS